jgi:zinc protease
MSRVRSDEGLAYSAGSRFELGVYYDGVFRAAFQSKSPSCAQAARIVLDEINRLRSEKVSAKELKTAVSSIAESLPRQFANARAIVNTFADDEYTQRDPKYWAEFQKGVRAVNADAVLRVAQKYLQPDKLAILAVGNLDAILKGDPDKLQYSLEKLAPAGAVVKIPLPDPMTLVYPKN